MNALKEINHIVTMRRCGKQIKSAEMQKMSNSELKKEIDYIIDGIRKNMITGGEAARSAAIGSLAVATRRR